MKAPLAPAELTTRSVKPDEIAAELGHTAAPDNPETLDQNGLTCLFDGEDAQKAVESLVIAHDLLPSQAKIQQNLARAHIAAGEPEKARPLLLRLIAWIHLDSPDELQAMLDSISAAPDPTPPPSTDSAPSAEPRRE